MPNDEPDMSPAQEGWTLIGERTSSDKRFVVWYKTQDDDIFVWWKAWPTPEQSAKNN